jgi:hypothetical protein
MYAHRDGAEQLRIRALSVARAARVILSSSALVGVLAVPAHIASVHLKKSPASPPRSVDYVAGITSFGLYRNLGAQAIGDCTLATVADMIQTWTLSAPLPAPPFIDAYLKLTDANPEAGVSVATVLNYWRTTGIDGYRITGWSRVTGYTSRNRVEEAMGNGALFATVDMPNADWELAGQHTTWSTNEAPAGVPVASVHALAMVGYDSTGPIFVTWGARYQATWSWWATWAIGLASVSHTAPPDVRAH